MATSRARFACGCEIIHTLVEETRKFTMGVTFCDAHQATERMLVLLRKLQRNTDLSTEESKEVDSILASIDRPQIRQLTN